MATISSAGIGSGLDVKTIVSQLMAIEQRPLQLLAQKEASYQAKLSAYGTLKSALSSFQESAQTLNLTSTYNTVKASVADTTILSATSTGGAVAGTYNIEVQSLAQSQKLISEGFAASDTVVGSGTLKIDLGTYSSASSPPVTFTVNPSAKSASITIDSTNNTLTGIRDAINNANTGVSASIINDGTSYRLSLTSLETGQSNAARITVTEDGAAGLSKLAFDASDGGVSSLTQNVEAKDAVIKVDGITITKAGNTITDAIQGVTLNLAKETASGVTTKLTLTRDTSTIKTALGNFVKGYNSVYKQISDLTAYNATTGTGSMLTGDATVRSVQEQLRSALSGSVASGVTGLATLSDVGVSFQKDGTLTLDSDKLDKVLADPLKDVSKLFTKDGDRIGIGSRINSLISTMIFGDNALLNSRMDGINSSIKNIGTQRETQNVRLEAIERRYNAQFTALDTAIASMTKTSSFLTQQLEALKAQTS